ncbi:MAG: winged helix-turn-helix domain-containing protein [Proteiniphilum sp.]|jgi:hypothetical protein|nr:winged helix-turn-helix domain-containing protein [Proteiniphilum sp.]
MNKKIIGTNAGVIWDLLNDYRKWDIPKLCEASGLSEKDLHTAIGWLARENKIEIEYSVDGNELFYLVAEYYF